MALATYRMYLMFIRDVGNRRPLQIYNVGATLAVALKPIWRSRTVSCTIQRNVIPSETQWSRGIYAFSSCLAVNRCADPSTPFGRSGLQLNRRYAADVRCTPLRDVGSAVRFTYEKPERAAFFAVHNSFEII